jgi:hypothetical protein
MKGLSVLRQGGRVIVLVRRVVLAGPEPGLTFLVMAERLRSTQYLLSREEE